MSTLQAQIPLPQTPFFTPNGAVSEVWYLFMMQLYQRTGGTSTPNLDLTQVESAGADMSSLLQSDTHTQANSDAIVALETWVNEQIARKFSRIEERLAEIDAKADFAMERDTDIIMAKIADLENHLMTLQKPVDAIIQNYINVTTFLNGWSNYGSPYAPAGYYKDLSNQVRLRGVVTGGTSGATIFVLPPGYRPEFKTIYPATTIDGGARNIIIDAAGNVNPDTGTSASFSLSGITFKAL